MQKVKSVLEYFTWIVVGALGVVTFVWVFATGVLTIYNQQRLGAEIRQVFATVDDQTDIVYKPSAQKRK